MSEAFRVIRRALLVVVIVILCYAYVAWLVGLKTAQNGAFYVVVVTFGVGLGGLFSDWLKKEITKVRGLPDRERKRNTERQQFHTLSNENRERAISEGWYPRLFPSKKKQLLENTEEDIVSSDFDFNVLLLGELRAISGKLNDLIYHVSGDAKRAKEESDALRKEMQEEMEEFERKWQALPLSEKRSRLEANLSTWATKGDDGIWRSNRDGTVIELNDDGTVKRK